MVPIYQEVIDADLTGYFDSIPHAELLQCVARRVSGKAVLHLVKMWLVTPVEERNPAADEQKGWCYASPGGRFPLGSIGGQWRSTCRKGRTATDLPQPFGKLELTLVDPVSVASGRLYHARSGETGATPETIPDTRGLVFSMDSVVEVNRFADLLGYRDTWNALWTQTRNASFFQSFDWFATYWRHYGEGQSLRILIVCSEGAPIGILPLVLRTESMGIGRVRVLTYPPDDWATFFGPIGPNATATLLAGMRHIRQTARDWQLVDLRWIDEAGCDCGRTRQAMVLAGFSPQQETWGHSPIVEIGESWEAYWAGRTKKWRHNVNRLQRRLEQTGEVRLVRHRPGGSAQGDDDPRWDLYDACVHLAERSWQGGSTTGTTLSHASVREFLRDVHAVAASQGCLDLNLLLVGDRPAAFAYNYYCRGLVSGLRMGYEPDLAAGGPGSVLQRLILEDTFRRGDSLYDFGPGYLECKRPWQTSMAFSVHYTHYPITVPRVQLLRLKRWLRKRFQPDYVAYDRCAQAGCAG